MDEETKEEGKEESKENPKEDSNEGIQSETTSELDRADQIAERQKRENDRRKTLLEREEALEARRMVGGRAEGGTPSEKPKEQTPKEYAEEVLTGKHNVEKK